MSLFIISFLLFGIILAAMSVGVIFSGRTIRGSCGGLNDLQSSEDDPVGSYDICG